MARSDERDTIERFAERYRIGPTEVTTQIERVVIGGDWGANGYTTMAQADLLGQQLGLGPHVRLLDLGAGRGWPGLYLAVSTGCEVVLSDVPIEGLETASDRARREGVAARSMAVAASAVHLPFARSCFDAVVHTDVL